MVWGRDEEEGEEAQGKDDYRMREDVSRPGKVWEERERSWVRMGEAEC